MSDSPTPPLDSPTDHAAVTVAITRLVRPEDQLIMRAWAEAGTSLANHFPGFLGSGWVRPAAGSTEWHMLYRFENRETLRAWEESSERQRWLGAGHNLVRDTRVEHRSGIEGWFDEPQERFVTNGLDQPPPPPAPPRWKQAIVIWCAFFPTSVLLTYLLAAPTHHWPAWLRVLLSTLIATPLMTYLVLPRVTSLFQRWLAPRTTPPALNAGMPPAQVSGRHTSRRSS